MKYFFTLLFISALTAWGQGQDKEVTLTVSGTGQTQNEAKERALRNAIEQAFGAFISSRTEILNDELISDQITSLTNGNITTYEIINEAQIPNGGYATTVKAIVSVNKLTSFVQSKGISVEIKGGLFAMNVKQQMLNEQAEINVVHNMFGVLHEVMQNSFDYKLVSGDPKSLDAESKNWEIPISVNVIANGNIDFCANHLINTLSAISLPTTEVENYRVMNKQVFPINISYNGKTNQFYLRKETSISIINSFTSNWEFYTRLFEVVSDANTTRGLDHINNRNFKCISSGEKYVFVKGSTINFLIKGQQAATYNWQEKYSLSEIEKITDFGVKPQGVLSYFKHGGYVLFEENGHGLVFSLSNQVRWRTEWDPPQFSPLYGWEDANLACQELVFNGYSDWRLPTKDEMLKIQGLFENQRFGNFTGHGYWTSTKAANSEESAFVALFIRNGEPTNYFPIQAGFAVRAVRSF